MIFMCCLFLNLFFGTRRVWKMILRSGASFWQSFSPNGDTWTPFRANSIVLGALHFCTRLPMSPLRRWKMMDCSSDNDRMLWHRMMDCSSDNDLMLWCHLKQKRSGAITNAKKLRRLRQIMPAAFLRQEQQRQWLAKHLTWNHPSYDMIMVWYQYHGLVLGYDGTWSEFRLDSDMSFA